MMDIEVDLPKLVSSKVGGGRSTEAAFQAGQSWQKALIKIFKAPEGQGSFCPLSTTKEGKDEEGESGLVS